MGRTASFRPEVAFDRLGAFTLRHSRVQTTLEIYQQNIPESQRMVVDGLVN
jgi:hypothetical protein